MNDGGIFTGERLVADCGAATIGANDLRIIDDCEGSLDLLAICRM